VPLQWPGLAALVVLLVDDDVAAYRAAELCSGLIDGESRAQEPSEQLRKLPSSTPRQ
jgi:hypothetical protein